MTAGPVITVTPLRLTFRAGPDGLRLPGHAATSLRGALGTALRDLTCATGAASCTGCAHLATCPYGVLWETPPAPPHWPRRYATPPRPYVLGGPSGPASHVVGPDDEVVFHVVLMGRASALWPQVVLAAAAAGARGVGTARLPASLVFAHDVDGTALYANGAVRVGARPASRRVDVAPVHGERVRLRLLTPLKLKTRGGLARQFDAEAFTARTASRLDMLALAWEGAASAWDHVALRLAARDAVVRHDGTRAVSFVRESRRSGAVPMEGLVGEVELEGVAPEVLGVWRAATWVHTGGSAAFGFGRVAVEVLP